jgi:hypothetical protein
MPTPSPSLASASPLLWLAGLFVLGFAVTWLLTDRGGMRRSTYIFFLAATNGAFTAAYLAWSETNVGDFLWHQWEWGLVGAAAGAMMQPRGGRARHGSA